MLEEFLNQVIDFHYEHKGYEIEILKTLILIKSIEGEVTYNSEHL